MLRIVVDSTADMPEELKAQFTIVPLNVSFGDDQYIDGVTIDRTTFYQKLAGCSKLAEAVFTSTPTALTQSSTTPARVSSNFFWFISC